MAKCVIALKFVSKLFQEKDSWETNEILDRMIGGISSRYVPTRTQLHRVMLKDHYNSKKDSVDRDALALWVKKVKKEKLVEVIE